MQPVPVLSPLHKGPYGYGLKCELLVHD